MNCTVFFVSLVMCLIFRVSTASRNVSSDNIKNFIGKMCGTNKDCPEPLYCSDNLECVECYDCSIYRRSKLIECPIGFHDCGSCRPGYVSLFVNSLPKMPYCLSSPVNMNQALHLAEYPQSYYVVHNPNSIQIITPNNIRPNRVIFRSYTRRICDTDKDCPESEYCYVTMFCAKCFDCSSYNRLNSTSPKCAHKLEDCGPCMPGYLTMKKTSDALLGEPCVRWTFWHEFIWTLGKSHKDYRTIV